MSKPSVVIIGAGFAGVNAVKELQKLDIDITLIDKNNYHTFYPLLYQVGAAELTAEQIAFPIRSLLRKYDNAEFVLGEVVKLDQEQQVVILDDGELIYYDYLVVATGTQPFFFGTEGAEKHCHTIDTLTNGERLRNAVLTKFEQANRVESEEARRKLLRFVIIGAGPTGVEYASALAELVYGPLRKDFPRLNMDEVEIIVVEAMDRVLPMLESDKMSAKAVEKLQKRNVRVELGAMVQKVTSTQIEFDDRDPIEADIKIWSAGVQASPMLAKWGLPTSKRGQVNINPDLRAKDCSSIFAIGDNAWLKTEEYGPLPNLAPVAIQMGKHVAKNIERDLINEPMQPFEYKNAGDLVVLGRYDAVARLWGKEFSGFLAWFLWGLVHIFKLIGFRNRLFVFINWLWDLFRFEKVERLIVPSPLAEEVTRTTHQSSQDFLEQ